MVAVFYLEWSRNRCKKHAFHSHIFSCQLLAARKCRIRLTNAHWQKLYSSTVFLNFPAKTLHTLSERSHCFSATNLILCRSCDKACPVVDWIFDGSNKFSVETYFKLFPIENTQRLFAESTILLHCFFSEIKFCRGWFCFWHFPTRRIFASLWNENKQTTNITSSAFYFRFTLIGLHLTTQMEVNSGVDPWIQWLPGRLIFSLSSPLFFS